MNKLDIELGSSEYHSSEKAGNSTRGYYAYHRVSVGAEILVNDSPFLVIFETGGWYDYNDYDYPTNKLSVSTSYSHPLLVLIAKLDASLLDNNEYMRSIVTEASDLCKHIETLEDLVQLYNYVNDSIPILSNVYGLSDNLDNYVVDDSTGMVIGHLSFILDNYEVDDRTGELYHRDNAKGGDSYV